MYTGTGKMSFTSPCTRSKLVARGDDGQKIEYLENGFNPPSPTPLVLALYFPAHSKSTDQAVYICKVHGAVKPSGGVVHLETLQDIYIKTS